MSLKVAIQMDHVSTIDITGDSTFVFLFGLSVIQAVWSPQTHVGAVLGPVYLAPGSTS